MWACKHVGARSFHPLTVIVTDYIAPIPMGVLSKDGVFAGVRLPWDGSSKSEAFGLEGKDSIHPVILSSSREWCAAR